MLYSPVMQSVRNLSDPMTQMILQPCKVSHCFLCVVHRSAQCSPGGLSFVAMMPAEYVFISDIYALGKFSTV